MNEESNVIPLPSVSEPFLTRMQLAKAMNVSLSTVDNWIAEGLPCERWGRRLVRIQLSRAIRFARERQEAV